MRFWARTETLTELVEVLRTAGLDQVEVEIENDSTDAGQDLLEQVTNEIAARLRAIHGRRLREIAQAGPLEKP
jgi:hypothetical protein